MPARIMIYQFSKLEYMHDHMKCIWLEFIEQKQEHRIKLLASIQITSCTQAKIHAGTSNVDLQMQAKKCCGDAWLPRIPWHRFVDLPLMLSCTLESIIWQSREQRQRHLQKLYMRGASLHFPIESWTGHADIMNKICSTAKRCCTFCNSCISHGVEWEACC